MGFLKENRFIAIAITIIFTIAAQIPGWDAWVAEQTHTHEHVVTIVDGIITAALILFATLKKKEPAATPEVKK